MEIQIRAKTIFLLSRRTFLIVHALADMSFTIRSKEAGLMSGTLNDFLKSNCFIHTGSLFGFLEKENLKPFFNTH